VQKLSALVASELMRAGVPCASIPPLAIVRTKNKKITEFCTDAIDSLLSLGITPVLYGDVVIDDALGGCVLSGDAIISALAKKARRLVLFTNVDGIYSADPKANPDAQLLQEISYSRIVEMIAGKGSEPGQNIVLDLPCCLILQRSNLRGIVLNGNDLANFERAVRGEQFNGTVISNSDAQEFAAESSGDEETEITPGKPKTARKKRKVSRAPSRSQAKKPAGKKSGKDFDPHDVYRIDFGR